MKKKAAIFGAGGHARVVAAILRALDRPIVGIFDDTFYPLERIQDAPVLGSFLSIVDHKEKISEVYLAIGDNPEREKAYIYLQRQGFSLPALIHPKAMIERKAVIQDAAQICIGAIIGAEASIGRGAIVNTGCAVDHESNIGDFVHLAPKSVIAGRAVIGKNSFVGMNSCVANNIRVGENVIIGAGAVVLRDVADGRKIVGVYH